MKLYFNRYDSVSQNTAVNIADCYYSNTDQCAQMYEKFADHTSGFTGINEWLSELTSVWEAVWRVIVSYDDCAGDHWIESTEHMLNKICSRKLRSIVTAHDLLGSEYSPIQDIDAFNTTAQIMLESYNAVTHPSAHVPVAEAQIKVELSCQAPTKQEDMLKFIQDQLDMNIVTCSHCGSVFIHHASPSQTICPHCNSVDDPSDHPDLFYPGWDDNTHDKELFSGVITDKDDLKVELSLKQSEVNVWAVDLRIEEGARAGE